MSKPRKKKSQTGSRQTNKYFHTLNAHLRLIRRSESPTQETNLPEHENSLAGSRRSTDTELLLLYDLWLSLSPREQDVTFFTCQGMKNMQIAFQMGVSAATVKSYLQNVFNKTGVRSKTELRLKFVNFDFNRYTPYQ